MKTTPRHLIWLAAAIAVFLAGCKKPEKEAEVEKAPVLVQTAKVEVGPLRKVIDVTGTFVAAPGTSAKLTAATAGRLRRVLVKEGDTVKKGQLLAQLDLAVQQMAQSSAQSAAAAAQSQSAQAEVNYRSALADQSATVNSAQIALDAAKLEDQNSVAQAQLAYRSAQADLAKLRAGARPQERAQAQETVAQARIARDRANTEYRRALDLSKDGLVSRRQLEEARAGLDTAESALHSAVSSESLIREGARTEELQAEEARTAAAREALSSTKLLGSRRVAQARVALQQARQSLLSVDAKRLDIQTNRAVARQRAAEAAGAFATIGLGEIRAPYAGKITRRLLNPGDAADPSTPVLEIAGQGKSVDFMVGATAEDAASLTPGMTTIIDLGNSKTEGRVVNVSPADPVTGLSSVRIASDAHALPGTFTTAHIVVKQIPNALFVPSEAVVDHEGSNVLFRVAGDTAKQIPVKTGAEEEGKTQILSGVKAGDVIVKVGQFELSDDAKIKVAEPEKKDEAKGASE